MCLESEAPRTRLVCEGQRKGKASAINCGCAQATGEIMLVTDANSFFDVNVLRELAPHFEKPEIGGVGGRYAVSNPDNSLPSTEQFYWDLAVSYTHLRAHETGRNLVCRLLLE